MNHTTATRLEMCLWLTVGFMFVGLALTGYTGAAAWLAFSVAVVLAGT